MALLQMQQGAPVAASFFAMPGRPTRGNSVAIAHGKDGQEMQLCADRGDV